MTPFRGIILTGATAKQRSRRRGVSLGQPDVIPITTVPVGCHVAHRACHFSVPRGGLAGVSPRGVRAAGRGSHRHLSACQFRRRTLCPVRGRRARRRLRFAGDRAAGPLFRPAPDPATRSGFITSLRRRDGPGPSGAPPRPATPCAPTIPAAAAPVANRRRARRAGAHERRRVQASTPRCAASMSSRSCPQNRWSPTTKKGNPNTPAATARSRLRA